MNLLITILILSAWFLSGVISFIYWWTKDYDYGSNDISISLFVGFAGPFSFVIGYVIHGKDKILIKRRGS